MSFISYSAISGIVVIPEFSYTLLFEAWVFQKDTIPLILINPLRQVAPVSHDPLPEAL